MRPVEKGASPRRYDEYTHARPDLIGRLGEYCSYCEGRIQSGLAVEHVLPKEHNAALALDWDNFLLACTNCNSVKGDKNIHMEHCYWPHRDNTSCAFSYQEGGLVKVNPALSSVQQKKAQATLDLTGLQKKAGNLSTASDRRWSNRREAWNVAQRSKTRLQSFDTPEMREQIVDNALARGFWSVWMTVFADDADMRRRFIQAFPGTCGACFDDDTNALPRPDGDL